MKKFSVLIIIILLAYVTEVSAWNDSHTHPKMIKTAVKNSGLNGEGGYLAKMIGLPDGIDTSLEGPGKLENFYFKFETKTILNWMGYGGEQEDAESLCRASNHFHNPLKPWDIAGLSGFGDIWPQILACSLSLYNPTRMESALSWATGFDTPGEVDEYVRKHNLWDWESARTYYFQYLAGYAQVFKDENTMITGKRANDILLASCFRSLGQVMHMLQDVSVPAHVRNDFSVEHLEFWPDSIPLNIRKIIIKKVTDRFGSLFEAFVWNNTEDDLYDWFKSGSNKMNLTNKPVTDLWDTNIYNGTADKINMKEHIGLAEYTNHNFFSKASTFKYSLLGNPTVDDEFPYPNEERLEPNLKNYKETLPVLTDYTPEGDPIYSYTIGSTTSHGERINHLVRPSFWTDIVKTRKQDAEGDEGDKIHRRSFRLDEECFKDYAPLLIPRAIDYSASLLDYFFRGKIEITQAIPVLRHDSFKYILVNAKNITPTKEAMTAGDFVVSCRYTPNGKNSDGSEDKFIRTNSISCPSLGYNQEMTRMFFTFINPIPKDAAIKKITLAYKGKLGEEKDAVIGTVLGTDELTQHNFGKILLEEDWKNVSTDDKKWTHANGSAEQGECSSIVENGILTKKNIRYAGQKIDLWNTSKYIPATPILITPNSSLQFKIDDMTVSHDIEASQYIDLKFSNGTGLFFTHNDGKLYFRAGTGFYKFSLGFIIIDNIYNLLKNAQITTPTSPEKLSLKEVSFTQMMWPANSPTEARHEQFMTSDFIQIIEGIRK